MLIWGTLRFGFISPSQARRAAETHKKSLGRCVTGRLGLGAQLLEIEGSPHRKVISDEELLITVVPSPMSYFLNW